MPYARTTRLTTPLVLWQDVRLLERAADWSPAYAPQTPRLLWPQSQWVECEMAGARFVADAVSPVWLTPDIPYRLRQPNAGQQSVVLSVASDLPATPSRRPRLTPSMQLAWTYVVAAVTGGRADPLALEEWLARMLVGAAPAQHAATARTRRAVQRAREWLANDPTRHDTLATIASAAHCSPFHLARHFRALTGRTLHDHRNRLRLSLALARLGDGACDLAALDADLGFASHSHFTAAFRAAFGIAPGRLRTNLTALAAAR